VYQDARATTGSGIEDATIQIDDICKVAGVRECQSCYESFEN